MAKLPPSDLRVTRLPLADLTPYPKNPRHITPAAVNAVAESLAAFGWQQPIVIDPRKVIVAGHTRHKAALQLGWTHAPTVTIPLKHARAYRLADNRSGEFSTWDLDVLGGELAALPSGQLEALPALDFSALALPPLDGKTDPDAIPEPPTPRTKLGDVWMLGKHRIMCGDSTDAACVARLLDGATPQILVTDPPYGVELDMEWRNRAGLNSKGGQAAKSYLRQQGVSGDTIADWSHAYELVTSLDTAYVWFASVNAAAVQNGLTRIGLVPRQLIVWVKPFTTISRSHYNWRHEPCWYAFKTKHAKWVGPDNTSTIWELSSPKMSSAPADEKTPHPTQKPIECMQRPIHNHVGDVYEPFSGSGTTIIAAEREQRRCYAMEIEPAYVDVTVARWEAFTGRTATR